MARSCDNAHLYAMPISNGTCSSYARARWARCLAARAPLTVRARLLARRGVAYDPQHRSCANSRSTAIYRCSAEILKTCGGAHVALKTSAVNEHNIAAVRQAHAFLRCNVSFMICRQRSSGSARRSRSRLSHRDPGSVGFQGAVPSGTSATDGRPRT